MENDHNAKKLKPADWRVDELDSGVEGVDPITQEGTWVAEDKVDEVKEVADEAGIELVEAEEAEEAEAE